MFISADPKTDLLLSRSCKSKEKDVNLFCFLLFFVFNDTV
ncbi:hypothetical protein HMPREF9141_0071 [Prevotella multiformis DSM 16608]|uniref:Uncharacterized protein n=1 Tax=Prevotella multiformis DSM 16608 TaxID=888743 RepID=F0F3A5_9BACT|nr:hypothetical protein HMPREF9141_0071 [Prevotella multiformis DSM 16608]